MGLTIDEKAVWYHGSNEVFDLLREGSTITQWQALAEAFSHKPAQLSYSLSGGIEHNGREAGYLYEIAEPVRVGVDIYPHPRSTMTENAEFLTNRPLKVRFICEVPIE